MGILGLDFLDYNHGSVDTGNRVLRLPNLRVEIPLKRTSRESPLQPTDAGITVALQHTVVIPPLSELEVMATVSESDLSDDQWLVESLSTRGAVIAARAIVSPVSGCCPVRLLNPRSEEIMLTSGYKVAQLQPISGVEILDSVPINQVSLSSPQEPSIEKQNLLWGLVQKCGKEVTDDQRTQLYHLLLEFADVFAVNAADFGRTDIARHEIDTGDARPIRQPPRRTPPHFRQEAQEMLKKMLDSDVIKKSNSPWASPVVLIRKKNGSLRYCVDYRKLNAVTRKDAYPLPRIDDTLDTLGNAKWFSTLDLISGYWQVELSKEAQEKTAFSTPEGLFEFKVLPFGLSNAPATFQRLMDLVLSGLQWSACLVYMDDIIVYGNTFSAHLHNLAAVFARLRQAGLKLQSQKCFLLQKEVSYLGHVVSERGVSPDPLKTEKVASWPIPKSAQEVQQFLGLAGYYRRFIKHFAAIARPLHRLTEKNHKFSWTKECQESFEKLRCLLTTSPTLAFPDFSHPFVLDTDASDFGLGGVLSQSINGEERPIAYASRALSKPERNYCTTRKELLAMVSMIKHFRPYLLGREFLLRTDHNCLIWLQRFKEPEGQLAHWLEVLQEYTFEVVHRRGTLHDNADALSRHPCVQCGRSNHDEGPAPIAGDSREHLVASSAQFIPSHDWQKAQASDPSIAPILRAKLAGKKPVGDAVQRLSRESRQLLEMWEQLRVEDRVLLREFRNPTSSLIRKQIIVPKSVRDSILSELHSGVSGCHLGEKKTLARLKQRYYWPGHWKDVHIFCQACQECATRKMPVPRRRAPLQSVPSGYPMHKVAMDIVGPLPKSRAGNKYILVISDYFSKWTEAYPLPNQEASTVALKLVDQWICRFSVPEQLHSDQGRQFESELIAEVCKLLNIKKTRTTAYHPQSDGQVERFNRTLLNMLATVAKNHPHKWEESLCKVCLAYNSSIHETTGYSPFFLVYGREARLPVDVMFGDSQSTAFSSPSEFVRDLRSTLVDAYDIVRQTAQSQQARQKDLYDAKIFGDPYGKGDMVWLHNPAIKPGCSRKLNHPWSGPYKVIERISEVTYCIQHLRNRKKKVVHFNRLKACQVPSPVQTSPPVSQQLFGQNLELVEDSEEEPPTAQPSTTLTRLPAKTIHSTQPPPSTTSAQPAITQSPPAMISTESHIRRNPPRKRKPPDWFMPSTPPKRKRKVTFNLPEGVV